MEFHENWNKWHIFSYQIKFVEKMKLMHGTQGKLHTLFQSKLISHYLYESHVVDIIPSLDGKSR